MGLRYESLLNEIVVSKAKSFAGMLLAPHGHQNDSYETATNGYYRKKRKPDMHIRITFN